MSATSRNPGNWHWTSKDCRPWTKSYFAKELIVSAEKNGIFASITKLTDCTGDVDVSMRKGKIITIYDLKIVLEFNGRLVDGTDVSGSITIPEVAYDTDQYVFEIEVFSETKENQIIKEFIKSELVPQIEERLSLLGEVLIETHGKDVLLSVDKGVTPKPSEPIVDHSVSRNGVNTTKAVYGTESASRIGNHSIINTVLISDNIDFQAPVSELYNTFIDFSRVKTWTRSSPHIDPKVGGKFSLFGGNVQGEFLKLIEPKEITQLWRLGTWPEGHYAKLILIFDQGMTGTTLRMKMEGVPVDQEDVVKSNFEEYYVKPIKTAFGYVNYEYTTRQK
ncbi:unnamed protein product [Pneumocystis jirovecii]|uniref:Activator of Hsp90 ATPase AHSA1-like N-terminal domain-containing protein n=1 Tax=Pneumocystis jirovecii TaxID=42068 RepID=L0PFS7_PNEJI|nr:unnamed protein product [Pneumocystis jirovecii]